MSEEFSLDWPHGWQFKDADAKYTGIKYVGIHDGDVLLFSYVNSNTGETFYTSRKRDGTYPRALGPLNGVDIINKPAPKKQRWWNLYSDGKLEGWEKTKKDSLDWAEDRLGKDHSHVGYLLWTEGKGFEIVGLS